MDGNFTLGHILGIIEIEFGIFVILFFTITKSMSSFFKEETFLLVDSLMHDEYKEYKEQTELDVAQVTKVLFSYTKHCSISFVSSTEYLSGYPWYLT